MSRPNPYFNPKPYVPATLSEIYDLLGSMILFAPTFVDPVGDFPYRNIDSEFRTLTEGFEVVRKKLGEQRYASLMDLAVRAKALFAADQDDANGKTDEGRALLFEMEDVLKDVRNRRIEKKLPDDEGEVTGD
ncbi:hypothetical protein RN629_11190 [Sphingomonadaceae bacterium jetA1]|jgi:hypothetical protein|uniref:hypothetical protein n=1 Tax=Facivitalis istanbulensis TaxID=3075838 RepID=UPI00346E30AD